MKTILNTLYSIFLIHSLLFITLDAQTSIFINEIHYDNSGVDQNESIEIIAPIETNLSDYHIVFYNGDGTIYATKELNITLNNINNEFEAVVVAFEGIQNGSPDGIALVDRHGTLLQFISYEGNITAVEGAALGVVSQDIGVQENGTTPLGASLQLNGVGQYYEDFVWVQSNIHSFGVQNSEQNLTYDANHTPPTEPTQANLFFSEYIEGSSYNKAVEIFNLSSEDVDLTHYSIELYSNGALTPTKTIALAGTIEANATFVLAHPSANQSILDKAQQFSNRLNFNGDDTLVLKFKNIPLDTIGKIGEQEVWGDEVITTQDNTLIRKPSIIESNSSFEITQWIALGNDIVDNLGLHQIGETHQAISVTHKIHQIQGEQNSSLLVGEEVVVEAIVIGDFQNGDSDGKRNLGGFYIQEEDNESDGNWQTSEGIFIYEGEEQLVEVALGDRVKVSGVVNEYYGETEIVASKVEIIEHNNTLPSMAMITLPSNLEAYEGMRVSFNEPLTITQMHHLDRFNEITLIQGERPNHFTQMNRPNVEEHKSYLQDILALSIVYDDGVNTQYSDGEPLVRDVRMGDSIRDLQGVLTYQWAGSSVSPSTWRVRSIEDKSNHFVHNNVRPTAPPNVNGEIKVASINLQNYFSTLGLRGATSQEELARQTQKIITVLESLDVDAVALMEVENNYAPDMNASAIAHLVEKLNLYLGEERYAYVDPQSNIGDDFIAVGVIYKKAKLKIATDTTVEILDDSNLEDFGMSGTIFNGIGSNRAPLAVTFEAMGERFTLVVAHLKSKGSEGNYAQDSDQGDGAGKSNHTRLLGMQALHKWLSLDPTGSNDRDVLIVGDMNAYAKEDPIIFLEANGYHNLAQEYSYIYDGFLGILDYAFVSSSMHSQITDAKHWHINADEPDVLDYRLHHDRNASIFDASLPYRQGDHDPLIVGMNLYTPLKVEKIMTPIKTVQDTPTPLPIVLEDNQTDREENVTVQIVADKNISTLDKVVEEENASDAQVVIVMETLLLIEDNSSVVEVKAQGEQEPLNIEEDTLNDWKEKSFVLEPKNIFVYYQEGQDEKNSSISWSSGMDVDEGVKHIGIKGVIGSQAIESNISKATARVKFSIHNLLTQKKQNIEVDYPGAQIEMDTNGKMVLHLPFMHLNLLSNGEVEYRIGQESNKTIIKFAVFSHIHVDQNGTVSTISETDKDGVIYRIVVITEQDGKSQTQLVEMDAITKQVLHQNYTLRQDSYYEARTLINVLYQNNKLIIQSKTPLNHDLIIE